MEAEDLTKIPIIDDVDLEFKNKIKLTYLKYIILFVVIIPVLIYMMFPILENNFGRLPYYIVYANFLAVLILAVVLSWAR